MGNKSESKKYPLHIHISTLVLALVVFFGLSTSMYNYWETSKMLVEAADEKIDKISLQLTGALESEQKRLAMALSMLAASDLSYARNLNERLQSFAMIKSVVDATPNMSGIQATYPNGDYFIIRPIAYHPQINAEVPDTATFVIDNISAGSGKLQRLFYDSNGKQLGNSITQETSYNPRIQPWYKRAIGADRMRVSEVHLFHGTQQLGLTFSHWDRASNVVIAADATLRSLSTKINEYQVSPSSELILIDSKQRVIAYKDSGVLVKKTGQGQLEMVNLEDLGIPALQEFDFSQLNIDKNGFNFSHGGQIWRGQTRVITQQSEDAISLLIISPENELVSRAIDIRNNSFAIQIIAIIFCVPLAWLLARSIARSLKHLVRTAQRINDFDFSSDIDCRYNISEVNELAISIGLMKNTINHFLQLVDMIANEKNLEKLIEKVVKASCEVSNSDCVGIYLVDDEESHIIPHSIFIQGKSQLIPDAAGTSIDIDDHKHSITECLINRKPAIFKYVHDSKNNIVLEGVCVQLDAAELLVVALPLLNRSEEVIGLLFIANIPVEGQQSLSEDWLGFMKLLSRFSAVTLQSRQLIHKQKELMQSFIKLIAGAIDAKSPYTGGHCQRVPKLTKMLAIAACESQDKKFRDFTLTEDQWEELHFASWLHDCGKVTTPEYVVDKSTKLETINDRIHEVRMRFEVLKRDSEIETLKAINELETGSKGEAKRYLHQLELTLKELDEEFIFVADCNIGGEFMSQEKIERLHKIAERTWQRTLDDRSGISWEELLRKQRQEEKSLPVTEKLLDNKVEDLIEFDDQDVMPIDNRWGFKLNQPKYKYDRGELNNLSVKRGTLTKEERYKINDHIVQTIIMLENLPYPKHLRKVPEIAGGHHEKMDGTGYPRRLKKEDMPLTARMMAIADIFEALTAADRPYKKPKKLSESLKIMSFMRKDQHIDPDLFELFLTSGTYLQYAHEYLLKEQIDSVDIQDYL